MRYKEMIATEDTTQMYDAWASYRGQLTNYVLDGVEDFYRRQYLLRTGKLRAEGFSLETELVHIGKKPVVAIWGAGNCSDLELYPISRIAKLVLIDREVARTKQARERNGLTEAECACIDLGFWEVYEEEERFFAELLEQGADDLHLSQYLDNLALSIMEQKQTVQEMDKLFDFSVVSGLASQLNARFYGLLHIYGRNLQKLPHVTASLLRMNENASASLYDMVVQTTKNAVFCGNELMVAEAAQADVLSAHADDWSEFCEEALLEGNACYAKERCEVSGSREFLQTVEARNASGENRIMHRGGIVWPFSQDRYYFMDVLMLEIVNKKTKR